MDSWGAAKRASDSQAARPLDSRARGETRESGRDATRISPAEQNGGSKGRTRAHARFKIDHFQCADLSKDAVNSIFVPGRAQLFQKHPQEAFDLLLARERPNRFAAGQKEQADFRKVGAVQNFVHFIISFALLWIKFIYMSIDKFYL